MRSPACFGVLCIQTYSIACFFPTMHDSFGTSDCNGFRIEQHKPQLPVHVHAQLASVGSAAVRPLQPAETAGRGRVHTLVGRKQNF